jgi:phosphoesterase RecJ-like protein
MVGHVNADGDVYGSLSALHARLEGRMESVLPLVFEPIPERYAFLDLDRHCKIFDPAEIALKEAVEASDLLFLLDLALPERVPGWSYLLEGYRGTIVCIDHHPPPDEPLGHLQIIDTDVCATGQLLYSLFRLEGGAITRRQALGLFTAIATDTGWFRYANTKAGIFAIAAELLKNDIDPSVIYGYIYQRNRLKNMKLLGKLLSNVQSALDGRFLWAVLSRKEMDAFQVDDLETEDLLDLLRSIYGSQCVALFRETREGGVRVNLRSKGELTIHHIARRFCGGGHPRAAGITVQDESLEEAERMIVEAVTAFMSGD